MLGELHHSRDVRQEGASPHCQWRRSQSCMIGGGVAGGRSICASRAHGFWFCCWPVAATISPAEEARPSSLPSGPCMWTPSPTEPAKPTQTTSSARPSTATSSRWAASNWPPSRAQADAVFRGTVLSLVASPLAYKSTNLSAEDRITVVLDLSFEESESGKVLWSNNAFSATGDYAVTLTGVTEASRRNALTKLASDAAERAYRLMIADF